MNRGFLELLRDFLAAAATSPRPTRTQLIGRANLNYANAKRLLEYAVGHHMVTFSGRAYGRKCLLTKHGERTLQKLRSIPSP